MEMIDIEQLLNPISLEKPTGCNLREDVSPDSLYYRIKDLRTQARGIEHDYMTGAIEKKTTEVWKEIYELTCNILQNKSKDLEICAWLIESALRLYSYQGLAKGFKVTRQLINLYWEGLYPLLDEDGIINKVAALSGLNGEGAEGTLIVPINQVVITECKQSGPYELWQYRRAVELSKKEASGQTTNKSTGKIVDLPVFMKAVVETSTAFFGKLLADLQEAIVEYDLLTNVLDDLCKKDAPASSSIKQALDQANRDLLYITKGRFPVQQTQQGDDLAKDALDSLTITQDSNFFTDREQAFRQLVKIAEYFRKAEPHSILPFVIERAVRWGNMAIEDLYGELITDPSTRDGLFLLVGIDKKSDS